MSEEANQAGDGASAAHRPGIAETRDPTGAAPADPGCGDDCSCPPTQDASWKEEPGAVLGNYRLLQLIGEGGFGVVYMAEQRQPVKRKVALKLIKAGMDTKAVIARFEAERQALALMDHTHIARVFDAGTTPQGRPFFVMELVRGVPITSYCDTENLATRERLQLFCQVCQAVQHAHQKGVIHRDLKPSNVMVTLHDSVPVPKVIDFGIAKATNAELTNRTLFTEFRQFIGTPEYMSPEQAEMSGLDIDTRTDIYSLGVLLYELLTGTTPFQGDRLRSAALDEIQRIIREEEPQRPSTRLSSLMTQPAPRRRRSDASAGSSIEEIAKRRRTDPRHLTRQMRGDLDWIIMKALEKDRTRRYCNASELAQDIERHLNDEPVSAGPPSATYRMRKFYRRHRGQVAAAAAVLMMFLLGLAGTTWAMVEANAQAREALEARGVAEAAMKEAEEERAATERAMSQTKEAMAATAEAMEEARQQAAIAEAVNRFLNEDLLASVAPDMAGRDVTVMQILERAARQVNTQFADQPRVMATLHHTIGKAYLALGRLQDAEPHLDSAVRIRRQELGEYERDTIAAEGSLASLYLHRGRYGEAEVLYTSLLERGQQVLDAGDATLFGIMNNLAVALMGLARFTDAEALLATAVSDAEAALGIDHAVTIKMLGSLANLAEAQGNGLEAERLLKETLVRQERALGRDHIDVLLTRSNLAMIYRSHGRLEEAERLQTEVLTGRRKLLGDDHPETFSAMTNLALIYRTLDRNEEAGKLLEEAVDVARRVLGDHHPFTMTAVGSLAQVYEKLERGPEAELLLKEALAGMQAALGPSHPETLAARSDLLDFYQRAGRAEDFTQLMTEQIGRMKEAAQQADATANLLNNAAYLLVSIAPESLRDAVAAVGFAQRACELTQFSQPYYLDTLACALAATGDPIKAIEIQKRALEMTPATDAGRPEMLAHLDAFEAAARALQNPSASTQASDQGR